VSIPSVDLMLLHSLANNPTYVFEYFIVYVECVINNTLFALSFSMKTF